MTKTYVVDKIQIQTNRKTKEAGTIDVYRGCIGCEIRSLCYAAKGARMAGVNFFKPVKRIYDEKFLRRQLERYTHNWIRIGCISDPSIDWDSTCEVIKLAKEYNKIPAVITKVYNNLKATHLKVLKESNAILQISTSSLVGKKTRDKRERVLRRAIKAGVCCSSRINSAAYPKNSKNNKIQEELISRAETINKIPILETPLRLFKTSNIWNLVDQEKYHRHLSPISGKLDSQRTAGLIINKAYPCFSTCNAFPDPIKKDPGCKNQCLTAITKWNK